MSHTAWGAEEEEEEEEEEVPPTPTKRAMTTSLIHPLSLPTLPHIVQRTFIFHLAAAILAISPCRHS